MPTPVSPMGSKLITLAIALGLLAWLLNGLYILRMALSSRDWKLIEGLLLDVHMEERRGTDSEGRDDPSADTFRPVVRYRYVVGRKTFESSRLWYRTDALGDYSEALLAIRDIRVGQPVDVYYDPSEPSRSVLIPGFETMNVATVAVSAIVFVVFLYWWL